MWDSDLVQAMRGLKLRPGVGKCLVWVWVFSRHPAPGEALARRWPTLLSIGPNINFRHKKACHRYVNSITS